MRRWQRVLLGIALLAALGSAVAQDVVTVRLGFLLNFARFIEWPDTSLKQGAPLRMCLAPGDAAMAPQFGELARQTIDGRPIQVKLLARPADVDGCHVVYLPAELPGPLSSWLDAGAQSGALTVGEFSEFVERGGMIGLVPFGGRYRFAINLGMARQAKLRISSHLLNLAMTVK